MVPRQASASRPPFTSDNCLRTVFNSEIVAPDASNARACASSVLDPWWEVAQTSVRPPPEIKQIIRSLGLSDRASVKACSAARKLPLSGTGCDASMTCKLVLTSWPAEGYTIPQYHQGTVGRPAHAAMLLSQPREIRSSQQLEEIG